MKYEVCSYFTKIEHGRQQILHDATIISKSSKMYGLYILYAFTLISYTSLAIQDFYDKTKL